MIMKFEWTVITHQEKQCVVGNLSVRCMIAVCSVTEDDKRADSRDTVEVNI
jgi:hypothetical protein